MNSRDEASVANWKSPKVEAPLDPLFEEARQVVHARDGHAAFAPRGAAPACRVTRATDAEEAVAADRQREEVAVLRRGCTSRARRLVCTRSNDSMSPTNGRSVRPRP